MRIPSRAAALAVLVGLATGAITLLGQGSLPGSLNQLANIGAPWLIVAMLVGSAMATDRRAAAAGLTVLLAALVGYYVASALLLGAEGGTRLNFVAYWSAVAVVGGPVFGVAGRWRTDNDRRRRITALSLLGGALLAEGIVQTRVAYDPTVGYSELVVGLVLPVLLARRGERLVGVVGLAAATILGVVAFALFFVAYAVATGA